MSNGICPFAVQKLLPESATQRRIQPRLWIAHSAAGTGSLESFFRWSSDLESTFWVSLTGIIEQYINANVRADANLDANNFALSFESENSRAAVINKDWDRDPWTAPQKKSIIRLVTWGCNEYPAIKPEKAKTWDGSGLAYHIQFGAPGRYTKYAKACPGRERIRQWNEEVIPAVGHVPNAGMYCPSGNPALKPGDNGPNVVQLQRALNYATGTKLVTDGDFGPKTKAAVANVQAVYKLTPVTGIYGERTHWCLQVACNNKG